MLIVLSVAAAAALVVVAYSKLRQHSPEAGTAGLRAVRDLADVVIVCVKRRRRRARHPRPTHTPDQQQIGYGSHPRVPRPGRQGRPRARHLRLRPRGRAAVTGTHLGEVFSREDPTGHARAGSHYH